MKLRVDQLAPDFVLLDQEGNQHRLSDYRGRPVLLYFYAKDDTPGCTREACQIRDNYNSFNRLGAIVLGISADSVKSHDRFAEKYNLPFTLLANEDKKVIRAYGVWSKKKIMGRDHQGTKRTSFLLNGNGKIVKIYENVKPEIHAIEVIEDLKRSTL